VTNESPLEVLRSDEQGIAVMQAIGPIDSATLDTFKTQMDLVCSASAARVLLDCRELTYVNSRGIGLLVKYHRSLMMSRGRFALCHLNPKLVRTMELLQIGKTLAIYPTREEALAALR
jgi:anti-sigma B factor antagonist